jgi:hypothetical protein
VDSIASLVEAALKVLPDKPSDTAKQRDKKRYSELVSERMAYAFAQALRDRGMAEARPAEPGEFDNSGAERRMSGGIGAKKVDVTWATEESGLLFAISVKSINFVDGRSKNFQKNLINRRGDMLIEAVTLHRRFPYAVLAGVFFLDKGAAADDTSRRSSTFQNANTRLRIFTGRDDPSGRDEQYERLYLALLDCESDPRTCKFFSIDGAEPTEVDPEDMFDEFLKVVAIRNPDFYEYRNGKITKVGR